MKAWLLPHLRYLRYVLRHKWFVLLAGVWLGVPLWQLLVHDLSKFSAAEWGPYVRSFYGPQPRTTHVKIEFDYAWRHHQRVNPHHWQYWLLQEDSGVPKALEMPEKYVLEMVADWVGVGLALGKGWENAPAWYDQQQHQVFHPTTRALVDMLINRVRNRVAAEGLAVQS